MKQSATSPIPIHEAGNEIPTAIELRDGLQLILIQEALHETAVDGLADAAVLSNGNDLHEQLVCPRKPAQLCRYSFTSGGLPERLIQVACCLSHMLAGPFSPLLVFFKHPKDSLE